VTASVEALTDEVFLDADIVSAQHCDNTFTAVVPEQVTVEFLTAQIETARLNRIYVRGRVDVVAGETLSRVVRESNGDRVPLLLLRKQEQSEIVA